MAERTNPHANIVVGAQDEASSKFAQIGQNAQKMGDAVERGASKASDAVGKIGDKAQPAADKLDGATRSIINSIERATAAMQVGEKGTASYYEALAKQRNVPSDALAPYIAKMREAEEAQKALLVSQNNVGVSAKQTAAALRGVPAQITDIVTSLQGGQKPLTVLLQQGGQLKDMFGGIVPAARALGSVLIAQLANPAVAASIALAGIAFAYNEGSKEADAYRLSLVSTGNAVGTTVGQMNQMAASIDAVVGTQGKAAETLALFAAKSVAGSDSLEKYAQSAIEWERASGQAVTETAKMFSSLQDDPLKSVLKLNEGMNFLTVSVLEQIKSLEDQGKTTEAAKTAQDALASALAARSAEMVQNLGYVERAWRGVKDAIAEVWDGVKNIGRDSGLDGQIAALKQQLAALNDRNASLGIKPGKVTADLENQIKGLEDLRENQRKSAEMEAQRAEAMKATGQLAQESIKHESDLEKKRRAVNAATEQYQRALQNDTLTQEQRNLLEQQYLTIVSDITKVKEKKDRATGAGAENELASLTARTQAAKLYYDQLITLGVGASQLNEGERKSLEIGEKMARTTDAKTLAILRLQKAQADALGLQLRVNVGLEDSLKAHQASIDAVYKDADAIEQRAKSQEAANATFGKSRTAIEEMTLAELQKQMAEAQASDRFDPKYIAGLELKIAAQKRWVAALEAGDYKKLNAHADELLRNAQEMAKVYADEQQLAGLTRLEREKVVALRQVEIKYAKELAAIDKMPENSPEQAAAKAEARAKVEQAKRIEGEAAVSKAIQDDWQRTTDEINRSLTDALLRGFESGKGFAENLRDTLKNMFNTLVLRPIISAVMNPVSGMVNGVVQGGLNAVGLGSGSSSVLGGVQTASNLNTLWGAGSQALFGGTAGASAASLGYANAVGMMGGDAIGALATANGMWAGVATGAQSAAQAAIAANVAMEAGTATALASGTTAAAAGGTAAAGAGAGITGALASVPVYGWIAAAAAVVLGSVLGRSTEKRGDGLMGTLGEDGGVHNLDLMRRGGSLFSGPKWFAEDRGVSAMDRALQDSYKAQRDALVGMGDALGLATDGVKNFTTTLGADLIGDDNVRGLRLDGLSDQEVKDKIAQALASASNEMAQQLIGTWETVTSTRAGRGLAGESTSTSSVYHPSEFARDGETALATLARLSTSLLTVNTVFDNLGDTLYQSSLAGADMASSLVDLLGGLDNFKNVTASYFQNFYSAAEQRDAVQGELERQFASLNLTLPDINANNAREQFRAIATSLDKTTDAGMKTWAALMQLSGTFASVTVSADEAARAAAQAEQERQQAAQRAAEEAARAAADAQRRMLAAQRDALNQQLQLIQESLSSLTSVFDMVHQAARELYGQVDQASGMQAAQGRTFIAQALAALRSTGYLPDADKLRDAIAAARGGLDGSTYASSAQKDYDTLVLANQLAAMEKIIGPQKTDAERQLEVMKAQIAAIDQTTKAVDGTTSAVYNLNASLSTAVKSDAIKSAFSSFSDDPLRVAKISLGAGWSMSDVASAWGQTPQQLQGYFANFGITSFSDAGQLSAVEQRYAAIKSTLGSYTADPQATYNISRSRGWTQYDLAGAFRQHPTVVWDFFDKLGIPRFAVGTNYVPRDMLAQIHEGEAIVPKAFNPWANGSAGGGNDRLVSALIEEVRALRAQVADLISAQEEGNGHTGQLSGEFSNWTMGGQGEIRAAVTNTVAVEVQNTVEVTAA